jgi:hypothetical protein
MFHTRLTLGDAARARILAGATALADAVRVTLGPKSRISVAETLLLAEGPRTVIEEKPQDRATPPLDD